MWPVRRTSRLWRSGAAVAAEAPALPFLPLGLALRAYQAEPPKLVSRSHQPGLAAVAQVITGLQLRTKVSPVATDGSSDFMTHGKEHRALSLQNAYTVGRDEVARRDAEFDHLMFQAGW